MTTDELLLEEIEKIVKNTAEICPTEQKQKLISAYNKINFGSLNVADEEFTQERLEQLLSFHNERLIDYERDLREETSSEMINYLERYIVKTRKSADLIRSALEVFQEV